MLSSLTLLAALVSPQEAVPTSTTERQLPHLKLGVRDARTLDRDAGRFVRRTTSASDGTQVDVDELYRLEANRRDAASGKLWGDLPIRLGQHATTPVVFWLVAPAAQGDLRGELDAAIARGASAEDARREALAIAARFTSQVVGPFVRALESGGMRVDYADPYVPLVFVDMPSRSVAAWARRDDVDQVFYAAPAWETENEIVVGAMPNEFASPSARTDYVHAKGITGAGVKVLVNDTAAVATNNPFLPPVVEGNPSASVASHATAVAGIIASTHPQHTGAAPGLSQLYSWGGSGDVSAPMAWSWGMSQGISFGNCSWWNFQRGSIQFLDRYFDYIIRNFGVMLFKSCGNQGNNQPITTPGNGFNVTASGNANDRNTTNWDDDAMSSSSSTSNPVEGHEKPEVSAHGTGITATTTSNPWIGSVGSGTSFASPVTCGVAALLAETDLVLAAKPEVVKAMLMAGAWNNIDGAEPLSDFDGAGGIDAAASQRAVADGQYVSTTLDSASFSPSGFYSQSIFLDAFDETRIVALWFSSADSSYSTDTLNMDLDMVVLAPGGNVVASRASAFDPFEIVQFVPPVTGNYTVRMQRQRFTGTSEPFALAWTTGQDAATNRVTLTGDGTPNTLLSFEWSDPYNPGAIFVGLMSLTPYPATMALGTDRILPMGFDGLSMATFAGLPGFFGTLDASGRATAGFVVPPLPPFPIEVGMFTLKGNPGYAAETSELVSVTLGR